jgi:hypothetical protein
VTLNADDEFDRLDARCVLMLEVTCDTLRCDPKLKLCEGLRLIAAVRTAVSRLAPAALASFDDHHLPRMRGILMERFGVSNLPTAPVN